MKMATRRCTVDGCDRKHMARGFCAGHYGVWWKQTHGRVRADEYFDRTCITCSTAFRSARRDGKYCSEICYHFDRWGPRASTWPRRRQREPKPKPQPFREQRECLWCEAVFVAYVRTQVYCSSDHKIRAKVVRRRGQQAGSTSHYTWAELMRVVLRFDRCCAYCELKIDGQPDPDHVVPLSKGGSNSITNILPACRLCNGDKRDLLLADWAADRERRGLPPRVTHWTADDPRTVHLTSILTAA